MDSFEFNKIVGAILGVVFVVFSVSILSDAIFASPPPETPGYAIEAPEEGEEGAVEEEEVEPVSVRLAEAETDNGESIFARCQSCHTVEEGGENKVGPNLWDVVGGPVTHREDFGYSNAMEEFSEGGEVDWSFERLDEFLADPKGYISGTAMAFAGLRDPQDRADILAYLHTLSNDPIPLPEPEEAEEDGESADASDGDGDETSGDEGDESGEAQENGEAGAEGSDEGSGNGEGADNGETGDEESADGDAQDEDAGEASESGEEADGTSGEDASGDEAEAGSDDQDATDQDATDEEAADEEAADDESGEGGDQDDAEIEEE